jgi:hypothetical protein
MRAGHERPQLYDNIVAIADCGSSKLFDLLVSEADFDIVVGTGRFQSRNLGNVQPTGATAVDRVQASQHYDKRTDYTFEALKTTLLVDCEPSAILDIHCSMTQPHDMQAAGRC